MATRMHGATKKHWFGMMATLFGCLAMVVAIIPVWVLPLVLPPDPIDKVVVDTAHEIKNRVVAKAKGIEYREPKKKTDWYQALAATAVILGVAALVFGAISFVAREPWRFAAAAGALGAGAILFQFSLMVAGAVIAVLFMAVVLNALGISL